MRRETALGLGLRLLGISLAIGPLLVAFWMHDWDIQGTVFDVEGFENVMNPLSEVLGENVGKITLENIKLSFDPATNSVRATFPYPPLPFSVTITDVKLSATVENALIDLEMESGEIETDPGETTYVHLIGDADQPLTDDAPDRVEGTITFEKYGVTIKTRIVSGGGS
jgi:hypothetical protein